MAADPAARMARRGGAASTPEAHDTGLYAAASKCTAPGRVQEPQGKEGPLMGYKICPYCGAHLDPGEECDCRREEEVDRAETDDDKKEDTNHE